MTMVRTPRRHHACDGAFNVRDLGGYPSAGGRHTRWGVLFRADALHRSPNATTKVGATLGWRTVLDLRSTTEVAAGYYHSGGVEVLHLPVLEELWDVSGVDHGLDAVEYLTTRYLQMLDVGAPAFRAAVSVLADTDRLPAVFHCAAGKDRTGVLAALVLSALGVGDDDIAADYHLSAAAMDQMVQWLGRNRPEVAEQMAAHPPALLACPPAAMHAFLAGLRFRFGSVERYLGEIGVTGLELDRLRQHLLQG
jgi:protein-tyrosine phosphatase